MAKRLTDSGKWNKPYLRSMKAPYKLLWLFILDECDHAGVWQVDIEVAQIKIGEKLNIESALESFKGKIVPFCDGEKWLIIDFIDFQYGKLNSQNRVHESVINLLSKYNLLDDENNIIKPLTSPLQGAKDKDKDKDMDKAMDKDKDKDSENFQKKSQTEIAVFDLPDPFVAIWDRWVKYKKDQWKFKYASKDSEETAKKSLLQLCEGDPDKATKILDYAIGNGYKGFFELKSNPVGQELSKEDKNKQSTLSAINILQKKYQEKQAV